MIDEVVLWINRFLAWVSRKLGVNKIEAQFIINITKIANNVLKRGLDDGKLDDKIRKHLLFVLNRTIQDIKDMQLERDEAIETGDRVMRLLTVLKEYKNKKEAKKADLEEVIEGIEDFIDAFDRDILS